MSHTIEQTGEGAREVLVIRASEWLRGRGSGQSGLWLNGMSCCLGLDAIRAGVPTAALAGLAIAPHVVRDDLLGPDDAYARRWCREDPWSASRVSNESAVRAMEINDDEGTTDEEKIEALRPIFARHNIEIDWRPNE